jgi:hypothetical protein
LFVPVSAILVLLIITPFVGRLQGVETQSERIKTALAGLMGVASYGFPFALIRRLVTRIALQTLKEFAGVLEPQNASSLQPTRSHNANEG